MTKTATATKSTRRTIPLDNEPLTSADLRAIRDADAAFARGDYCTVDDLEDDLIRRDLDRDTTMAELDDLITAGANSPGELVTDQWWKDRYAELERHRHQRAKKPQRKKA